MLSETACKKCGRQLDGSESVCPECNNPIAEETDNTPLQAWEKEFNKVRFHWVVVVIIFWVTCAITAGLFLIHGEAYLNELVFIAAIFMVLGVYLKTKVMRIQRKKPGA